MRTFSGMLFCFLLAGCVSMPKYNAPRPYTADMSKVESSPITMMVAHPMNLDLYIVIDPTKVEDTISIKNSRHTLKNFRNFFSDGLKKSLESYFNAIHIVEPDFQAPETPYVLAETTVRRVEAVNLQRGYSVHSILTLNWSIGIRPSDAANYTFSFSGVGTSADSYQSLEVGTTQMLESGLNGFLQGWTEKEVPKKLREHYTNTVESRPELNKL